MGMNSAISGVHTCKAFALHWATCAELDVVLKVESLLRTLSHGPIPYMEPSASFAALRLPHHV